ncbi:MAG: hypothetical protein V1855_01600, partial [bacterium]
ESEHMLFTEGIRFPLPYQFFLDDLVKKLANQKVKNVVFVDFLSMYPRSSRENIRINYLLQQLALLDVSFDVQQSMYKDFVSGGQLLHYLLDRQKATNIAQAFSLESFVRVALCKYIVDRKEGDLQGMSVEDLTRKLSGFIKHSPESFTSYVQSKVLEKIIKERRYFEDLYGLSKSFVNIQQFDFFRASKLCKVLRKFFTTYVENSHLEYLWEDPGKLIQSFSDIKNKRYDSFVGTDDGLLVRHCYTFSPHYREELYLTPFLRMLRASWYATLSNLIFSVSSSGKIAINQQIYPTPPLFVSVHDPDTIHVFQKAFEPWKGKVDPIIKKKDTFFHLSKQGHYGELGGVLYRINWDAIDSCRGMFAFSCDCEQKQDNERNLNVITRYVKKYQNEHGPSSVFSASELYETLKNSSYWKMEYKNILKNAANTGPINFSDGFFYFEKKPAQGQKQKNQKQQSRSPKKKRQKKFYWGRDEQKDGVRLWVRLIATLEMIVKDPDSPVAVRFGDKKDFKAALHLLEKAVLPRYFNIIFKKSLFDDYDAVEPYPSWNFWED